jgi:hypothetical protein
MDPQISMAVFKRTVEAGSFAAAAGHFGILPETDVSHVPPWSVVCCAVRVLGVRYCTRPTR